MYSIVLKSKIVLKLFYNRYYCLSDNISMLSASAQVQHLDIRVIYVNCFIDSYLYISYRHII